MRWSQTLLRSRRGELKSGLQGLAYLMQSGIVHRVGSGLFDFGMLGVGLFWSVANWLHVVLPQILPTTLVKISLLRTAPPFFPRLSATPSPAVPPSEDKSSITSQPAFLPPSWYAPLLLEHAQSSLFSYKQLPQHLVTEGPLYREERRIRAGLLRSRIFHVIEGVSLASDLRSAHEARQRWEEGWQDLLIRAEIHTHTALRPDPTGHIARAAIWTHSSADTPYLHCPVCDTWYHPAVAPLSHPVPPAAPLQPLKSVATPEATTIKKLCQFLDISPKHTAKSMFLIAGERLAIIALVRGDTELSLAKLRRVLGPVPIRTATLAEVRALGAEPGYGSPVGISSALVVVDALIALTPNLVAGANTPGYHLLNVNPVRDYSVHIVADIIQAPQGALCARCGTPYEAIPAWVLASVTWPFSLEQQLLTPAPDFAPELGELRTSLPVPTFLRQDGHSATPWVVRAVLGVERLLAATAETHHDRKGLTWPRRLAPYDVHLISILDRKNKVVEEIANKLYESLKHASLRVLYDDREERAGVKFKDADLLGAPIRLVVSPRTLKQGCVELKLRRDDQIALIPLNRAVTAVLQHVSDERSQEI